jgi:hypothetical protein
MVSTSGVLSHAFFYRLQRICHLHIHSFISSITRFTLVREPETTLFQETGLIVGGFAALSQAWVTCNVAA